MTGNCHVRFGGGQGEKCCKKQQLARCLPYNFSVAVNRRWNDRVTGAQQEEVTWYRVSVWGRQAEAANEYLEKGRQVLIEGRLRPDPQTGAPRLWTRTDGSVGASFEVVADRVQFLGGNGNGHVNGTGVNSGPAAGAAQPDYQEDEIPF